MKTIFRFKFNTLSLLSGLLCLAVSLISVILTSISLARWNYTDAPSSWTMIIALVSSCLLMTFSVLIVSNSKYIVGNNLKLVYGVFSTMVEFDKILLLRTNPEKSLLLMYYKATNKKGEEKTPFMSINVKDFDAFCSSLRAKNPHIIYEIFDKNADKENSEE